MPEFDPVFNPPGCQVEAIAPIDALPEIICELPQPELTPIRDCRDPSMPVDVSSVGLQGPRGYSPRGATGEPGMTGATGPKGATGDPGDMGPTGYPGAPGLQGPQGPAGPRGPARGPRGLQGYLGETGAQGSRGPTGKRGEKGLQGDMGPPGETGPQGPPGATGCLVNVGTEEDPVWEWHNKCAIVETTLEPQFVKLYCTEMPETLFEDFAVVTLTEKQQAFELDPRFIEACEPGTLRVTGCVFSQPCVVGASVDHDRLHTVCRVSPTSNVQATFRISGQRRGFTSRFPAFTREQMERNNEFWRSPAR